MADDGVSPEKLASLRAMVKDGKASVSKRSVYGIDYIRFREKGTGKDLSVIPYDEGLFNEFKGLVPVQPARVRGEGKGVPMEGVVGDVGPPRQGRPPAPSAEEWREWAIRFGIGTDVIAFWEYATQKGYYGSLGTFVNDVVRTYFEEHGVELAIMRSGIENVARNQN